MDLNIKDVDMEIASVYNGKRFFSWDFLFGYLSSPPRVGYLEPYGVFFILKFLVDCDMPPVGRGCRPLGGVLSVSSGDMLK